MMILLAGENSFEIEREVARLIAHFDGDIVKVDGEALELSQLPDLIMGMSLFMPRRLVIIKNLSENKILWTQLGGWLEKLADTTDLVLVEPKPDKRTKTYKELQKLAEIKEYKAWTERDTAQAEKWLLEEAERLGATLDKKSAQALLARVGLDQWQLYHALQKLALLDEVTPEIIQDIIEPTLSENVFLVFEAALKGDKKRVASMLQTLRLSEDPYRLFGLITNQAFYVLVLSLAGKSSGEVAKDLAVHPFVLSKLAPLVKTRTKEEVKTIVRAMIEADEAMKTSAADPWLLLERALIKVTNGSVTAH